MTSNRTLLRRLRSVHREEDGSAILLVMLAMLLVGSLSVLALGAVIAQVQPSVFEKKSLRTINGAEAGLDAGLAAIRNATALQPDLQVLGDRSLLPCWTNYTAPVNGTGADDVTFRASIRYYSTDPSNQTEAWRATNFLTCGNFGPPVTPNFALLQSSGRAAGLPGRAASLGNRSVETVYSFKLTDTNVSGGLIRADDNLCYAVPSGIPTVGMNIYVQACAPGTAEQLWAYGPDWTIQLTASQPSSAVSGLCISSAPANNSVTTVIPTLQVCNGGDVRQKWGVSDGRAFFGHLTGNYDTTWCLAPASNTAGQMLRSENRGGRNNCPSALADAQVGAGGAGELDDDVANTPMQWVNYKEFGRCLDITNWITDPAPYPTGRPSEISYPCKQDPMRDSGDPRAKVGWNQTFTWNSTNKSFFLNQGPGTNMPNRPTDPAHCMRTPGTTGGYIYFQPCPSTVTTAYQWTVNRETGAANSRYTIVDGYGRCLSVGRPSTAMGSDNARYSSIIVATCNGSTAQKWNAPPDLQDAPTKNTQEIIDH